MGTPSGLGIDWSMGGGQGAICRDHWSTMGHPVALAEPFLCATGNGHEGPSGSRQIDESGRGKGHRSMNRWDLLINAITGRDRPVIAEHEQRLNALENRVNVIEGLAAFRRMVRDCEEPPE